MGRSQHLHSQLPSFYHKVVFLLHNMTSPICLDTFFLHQETDAALVARAIVELAYLVSLLVFSFFFSHLLVPQHVISHTQSLILFDAYTLNHQVRLYLPKLSQSLSCASFKYPSSLYGIQTTITISAPTGLVMVFQRGRHN